MKHLRLYILIAIGLLIAFWGIAHHFEQEAIAEQEAEFNRDQQRLVSGAALTFENLTNSNLGLINSHVDWFADPSHTGALTVEDIVKSAQDMLANYPATMFAAGYYVRRDFAVFQFAQEDEQSQQGLHLLDTLIMANWATIQASDTSYIPPLELIGSTPVMGVLRPLIYDDRIVGVWGMVIHLGENIDAQIVPTLGADMGTLWVLAPDSRVLMHPQAEWIGQTTHTVFSDLPEQLAFVETALATKTGLGEFQGIATAGQSTQRQLAAWDTVTLGNQQFVLLVIKPAQAVSKPLKLYRRQAWALGLLVGLVFLVSAGSVYIFRQRELHKLVDLRTAELRQLNLELEDRVTARTVELAHERAQLRMVFEAMEDAVIYREQGRPVYANAAFERVTGYTLADIQTDAKEVLAAMRDPHAPQSLDDLKAAARQALDRDQAWHGRACLRHRNGTVFEAELYVARVANGDQLGMVEIIRDVSEVNALRRQQDRFLTNAAHQLRLPLSNLKSRLYLLRRQPEKQDYHLDVVEEAVDHMTGLVKDLVDMAQYARGDIHQSFMQCDVNRLVKNALPNWQARARQREVSVDVTQPAEAQLVLGDVPGLTQVLETLFEHALLRSDARQTIRVRVEPFHAQGAMSVRVHVMDDGPPLDLADYGQLFEPFFEVTEGSHYRTGLRLAIARQIIERHGGQIAVIAPGSVQSMRKGQDGTLAGLTLSICVPALPGSLLKT